MLGGVVLFEVVAERWGFNYGVGRFFGCILLLLACLCWGCLVWSEGGGGFWL